MIISKSEVFPYAKRCAEEYERVYREIKKRCDLKQDMQDLCTFRGYALGYEQSKLIEELGICHYDMPEKEYEIILGDRAEELGLVTKNGYFLLNNRYIIPVRDALGNLVTLIGYYPDAKKYITVPAPFFSKDVLFFNFDHAFPLSFEKFGGVVVLVEGIFDCLSLRAIGLPAIATMGSTVSREKYEILHMFNKVLYIPDNDAVGRKALNRRDKVHGWRVPSTATGLRLQGIVDFRSEENMSDTLIKPIKDVDNLISWFDGDSVREEILKYADSRMEIEDFDMGCVKYFDEE